MKIRNLLFIIFIFMFSILTVNAASIRVGDTYVYNDGPTGNSVQCITYDDNAKTLTMNGCNIVTRNDIVIQDVEDVTIIVDGSNNYYGDISSNTNFNINGVNNGVLNIYSYNGNSTETTLNINNLTVNIYAYSSYSVGFSANDLNVVNSTIKGVAGDGIGLLIGYNITLDNSTFTDMGSEYKQGDMGAINAYSSVTIKNNSNVTIYPLGYDRNYDFLDVFNLGFAPYDYSHDYTDTWFDGRGIFIFAPAEDGIVTISDSTVNIKGKRECIHSTNIETTNSNINLECFYGVVGSNMTVNSGNVIEKGAVVGIKTDILNVNGGYLSSSVMDDDTKAGFINYMENDSNESRAALEEIETYTPYMISIINYPDTYGMFINGGLPGSIGNPDDIVPSVNPGQYIRRGDQEVAARIMKNIYSANEAYNNLANDPNTTQEELDAMQVQIEQLVQQYDSYLIDAADVDPNKIVIDKINTLEIKPLDGNIDTNVVERLNNVPKTGIVTFVGVSLGIIILAYGAYIVLKSKEKQKPVI